MANVTVILDEPGPHPGWRDIFIDRCGDLYRLRIIDEKGRPRTHVAPAHYYSGKLTTGPGGVKVYSAILTPEVVDQILTSVESANAIGRDEGREAVQFEIRKALGL